jgi:hypothetical protein
LKYGTDTGLVVVVVVRGTVVVVDGAVVVVERTVAGGLVVDGELSKAAFLTVLF